MQKNSKKIPILFIHGFGGYREQYLPLMDFLKKEGFNKFYEFNYDNKFGSHSIKKIAKQLSEFIQENITEESINIIAHSQGGIIALAYLKYFKNKKVEKLFTVCTPYYGTILAKIKFINRPGIIDLRPRSELLKDLECFSANCDTEIYSIYTPLDLMVFPGWSARNKYGKKKIILAPMHDLAFCWPSTKKFILRNIILKNKYERISNFIRKL